MWTVHQDMVSDSSASRGILRRARLHSHSPGASKVDQYAIQVILFAYIPDTYSYLVHGIKVTDHSQHHAWREAYFCVDKLLDDRVNRPFCISSVATPNFDSFTPQLLLMFR